MITWTELLTFCLVIIGVISLCFTHKKQLRPPLKGGLFESFGLTASAKAVTPLCIYMITLILLYVKQEKSVQKEPKLHHCNLTTRNKNHIRVKFEKQRITYMLSGKQFKATEEPGLCAPVYLSKKHFMYFIIDSTCSSSRVSISSNTCLFGSESDS